MSLHPKDSAREILGASESRSITQLWSLRIFHGCGKFKDLFCDGELTNPAVAVALGMSGTTSDNDTIREADFRRGVKRELTSAEVCAPDYQTPGIIRVNAQRVAQLVNLTPAEQAILEFVAILHTDTEFSHFMEQLGDLSASSALRAVAIALNLSTSDVTKSLSSSSTLARTKLVALDRGPRDTLMDRLCPLSREFIERFAAEDTDPIELLKESVLPCRQGTLTLDDYEHLPAAKSLLLPYLSSALASRKVGVNILIHGPSGSGKSELCRAVAKELGCSVFEVSHSNAEGGPFDADDRLAAYSCAQSFLGNSRALLALEEIEDIFKDTWRRRKAWINHALETNVVPTIWLSNDVECLDPAYVRRFDLVIHLPLPPEERRKQILSRAAPLLVDCPGSLARLVRTSYLSPAMATRAATVAQAIASEHGSERFIDTFQSVLSGTFHALGKPSLSGQAGPSTRVSFDPRLTNAGSDLVALVTSLGRARCGRICLYGPPGTGKTAYAHWLADQLGMPILTKRASELLDQFVGNSEKRVAGAFDQATREGAILHIDEVDSFLQSRTRALASWEISIVNEMLTQMETFTGVFIASTNLMDSLDEAVMRRFDLKIRFNHLKVDQAWAMLGQTCAELGIAPPDQRLKPQLDRLRFLTPGDFAAVRRRCELVPVETAAGLVTALSGELQHRSVSKPSIGFV